MCEQRKVGTSKRARLSSFSLPWFISLRHQSLLFRAPLYAKYKVAEELVGLYWPYHKGKCIDFCCNVTQTVAPSSVHLIVSSQTAPFLKPSMSCTRVKPISVKVKRKNTTASFLCLLSIANLKEKEKRV